ncbi:MFS transporter [Dactylosporangium sp. AC04546]|uniref:MFS transporter n=1 Tax=Dactylosporangium sp. AC04546 TaxID=2862460 RepID=UPI002E7C01A0|nr:MFS transporter [Dactylosporangium sp. AC04546]WVK79697.1 MFS transporter [Dactylosporangium sp. AC04546]
MPRSLIFLFAVASGAAVGNLYWAQPLLDLIAGDLHASQGAAGWLITATQLGYATGILLIVPLGDVLDRRRLVPVMLLSAAAALVLCAVAPSIGVLLAAITLLGITTVAGQIITPLAGDMADERDRGRVVGIVASGILTGILASRTVSGLVAGVAGWRSVYAGAAVLAVVLAIILYRRIPPLPPKDHLPYPRLIASIATVALRERTVRWTLLIAATGFAAFTMFWTALTFLLSAPPFGYPVPVIGLFGLAGLAGAVAAQRAGRLHDRGWSMPATGLAWLGILVAFGVALAARLGVVFVLAAIVLLDVAMQTQGILNQTRIFAVSGQARSRLNTAYITGNFIAGAMGSAAAAMLWMAGGWTAVAVAGMALSGLALAFWAILARGTGGVHVAETKRGPASG